MSKALDTDTIAAIATAPGRGGVGIVRLSGPDALPIAVQLAHRKKPFEPRTAEYARFFASDGDVLDTGICLTFIGPASFTGEDVAELQGHGSPVVLDAIVRRAVELGARLARPGEFSERAYLNGKMDLAQAEAVADLINAASDASARAAVRSLQGQFSRRLNDLSAQLVGLRVQVEAAIDFPDEDIELLEAPAVRSGLDALLSAVSEIIEHTRTGVRLTEGARLVLLGAPNVGKSSVLNQLCGEERAIVTDIAGTTRDVLREQLLLNGVPVEVIDTAGLRDTDDQIEAEGVRRARQAAAEADLVLAIYDVNDPASLEFLLQELETERSVYIEEEIEGETADALLDHATPQALPPPWVLIGNKVDLQGNDSAIGISPGKSAPNSKSALTNFVDMADPEAIAALRDQVAELKPRAQALVSAKTGTGLQYLTERLVGLLGGETHTPGASAMSIEQTYSARTRHLLALQSAHQGLLDAQQAIRDGAGAELVAEHLRIAQDDLGSVCGEISSDALLGEIFSNFCIGK